MWWDEGEGVKSHHRGRLRLPEQGLPSRLRRAPLKRFKQTSALEGFCFERILRLSFLAYVNTYSTSDVACLSPPGLICLGTCEHVCPPGMLRVLQ